MEDQVWRQAEAVSALPAYDPRAQLVAKAGPVVQYQHLPPALSQGEGSLVPGWTCTGDNCI